MHITMKKYTMYHTLIRITLHKILLMSIDCTKKRPNMTDQGFHSTHNNLNTRKKHQKTVDLTSECVMTILEYLRNTQEEFRGHLICRFEWFAKFQHSNFGGPWSGFWGAGLIVIGVPIIEAFKHSGTWYLPLIICLTEVLGVEGIRNIELREITLQRHT